MTTEQSRLTSDWWAEKTRLLNGTRALDVEIYLRSLAPPAGVREQQESILTRLRALKREGRLGNLDEIVWGKAVSPEGQCKESPAGRKMLGQIEAFREWAATQEPPVNIPFEETRTRSEITGEQFRRIVLPTRCMSLSVDDTLELVVPCRIDGETIRIQDLLEAFEDRQSAPSTAIRSE